jgi:hypothetical protein
MRMKQSEKSMRVSRTGTCFFDCQREAFENLLHSAAVFSTVMAQEKNNFSSRSCRQFAVLVAMWNEADKEVAKFQSFQRVKLNSRVVSMTTSDARRS